VFIFSQSVIEMIRIVKTRMYVPACLHLIERSQEDSWLNMPWVYCAMFAHTHQNTVVLFFFGAASVASIFLHLGGTITSSFGLQKKMSKMIWPHRTILIYTSLCRAGLKLFPGAYCQLKCIPLSIYLSISVYLLFQPAHSQT